MKYFRIKQWKRFGDFYYPKFEYYENVFWKNEIAYYKSFDNKKICHDGFLPFIERPTFIIKSEIKYIFELFQPKSRFYNISYGNAELSIVENAFIFKPISIDCLDESSKFLKNGMIKEIILNESKISSQSVFKINNIIENILIVNLLVLELILSSNIFLIEFEELKTV